MIWNSLNAVRLNDIITTLAKQQGVVGSALNINIEHGGKNLSGGATTVNLLCKDHFDEASCTFIRRSDIIM